MGDTVKYVFLIMLILYPFSVVRTSNQDTINAFEPYKLEIIDFEINSLVAHCRSKNNDFGAKILIINDEIHWEFRRDIGETTTFYCKFAWMTGDKIFKETEFEVFNSHIADECGNKLTKTNKCFWSVSQVGFSFAKDSPSNWVLKQRW